MPANRAFFFKNHALIAISDAAVVSCDPESHCCMPTSSHKLEIMNHDDSHQAAVSTLKDDPTDCKERNLGSDNLGSEHVRINVRDKDFTTRYLTLDEIGTLFGFTYLSRLIFLHESDLRNYGSWGVDLHSNTQGNDDNYSSSSSCGADSSGDDGADSENVSSIELTVEINNLLTHGGLNPNLFVQYVPDVGDITIGYGLFASDIIRAGLPIGEYVGILLTSMPEPSSYSLNYPCCDGNHEINATEYGNLTRFINHSSSPNSSFKHVHFEGIVHVVCVSFFFHDFMLCLNIYHSCIP